MTEYLTGAGAPILIFSLVVLILSGAALFKANRDQVKSKIGEAWYYALDTFIDGAVRSAEAVAKANGMTKAGESKMAWVKQWVADFMKLTGNKLPESIIEPMIEAAVASMSKYSGLDKVVAEIKPIEPFIEGTIVSQHTIDPNFFTKPNTTGG